MRFRKIPLEGCVRAWVRKIEIFAKNRAFAKMVENHEILDCLRENRVFPNFGGPAGGSALERASPPGLLHMTRRAVLRSKGNTGAREIEIKYACQKLV